MDEIRKTAYAYLMQQVFVDIRNISGSCHRWRWNPFKWPAWRKALKCSHQLADAFHNLPVYINFGRFDEEAFWAQLENAATYGNWHRDYRKYRKIFEEELSKLAPKS